MDETLQVYSELGEEPFYINNTRLMVTPIDVSLFSDNAIFGTTFLRSRAVFAYRSRHAREKVVLTLPISLSVTSASNDAAAIYSREDGLKVLTQLLNFPFCFIKSPRIESYIGPAGSITSEGFMIFGVSSVKVLQDMSTPDVLFVEFHLIFSNTTSLVKGYKFKCKDGSAVDYPGSSDLFIEVFENLGVNKEAVEDFLEDLALEVGGKDTVSESYVDVEIPYGTTIVLAPHIEDEEELAAKQEEQAEGGFYNNINPNDIKRVKISASRGDGSSAMQMLSEVETKERDEASQNYENLAIIWKGFSDIGMYNLSALQSISILRSNQFSSHFISAHKHPVLQYLGVEPAKVTMSFLTATGDSYKTGETSFLEAYSQLFNILDYNAVMFPGASAYNYLKIRGLAAFAMGVEKIIPSHKYIGASSAQQGIENLNLTFVETNTDEFLKLGKVELGRESSQVSSKVVYDTVTSYLSNLNLNINGGSAAEQKTLIYTLLENANNGLKAMAMEFGRGVASTRFSDQKVFDNAVDAYKRRAIGGYKHVESIKGLKDLATAFVERSAYRQTYKELGKEGSSKLSGISIQLSVKTGKTDWFGREDITVDAGNFNNFIMNGKVDNILNSMFIIIQKLAYAGNSQAEAAINSSRTATEVLADEGMQNFTGSNYLDLSVMDVATNPFINPMDFLYVEPLLSEELFKQAYELIEPGFNNTVDKILRDNEELRKASGDNYNELASKLQPDKLDLRSSVLKMNMEIEEQAMLKDGSESFGTDAMGSVLTSSPFTTSATSSTYYTPSGSGTDWNNPNNMSSNATNYKRAVDAIRKAVASDGRIPEADKLKWVHLLVQIAGTESKFSPTAVSPTGAVGLFQFTQVAADDLNISKASVSGGNFDNASKAALNYIIKLNGTRAINDPLKTYGGFNIGAGGIDRVYKVLDGKADSLKYTVSGKLIDISKLIGYQSKTLIGGNDKETAKNYMSFLEGKMGPVRPYLNLTSKKTENNTKTGVTEDLDFLKGISKETIKKEYVLAELVDKGGDLENTFKIKSGGKTYTISIKGILIPIAPVTKEISIKGGKRVRYTEVGQRYGKEARAFFLEQMKGDFYIEKPNGSSFATNVFNQSFANLATKALVQGFAMPDPAYSLYSVKNVKAANYLAQKDKITPSSYLAEMSLKRSSVLRGESKLSTIVEKGTTPIYIDGSTYKEEELKPSDQNSTKKDYSPSAITNNWLPFKSGTGRVTSEYGKYRTTAKNGVKREGYHFGIDCVPTDGSTECVSAAKGVVITSKFSKSAGNMVTIYHDTIGFTTQYFHLANLRVKEGDRVQAGTVVGNMGNTGAGISAVHAHYQVHLGRGTANNAINPFSTTRLSDIPDYNTGSELTLQQYSFKFLNKDFDKDYKGSAINSNYVYKKGTDTGTSHYGDVTGTGGDYSSEVAVRPTASQPSSRGIGYDFSVFNQDLILKKHFENMATPFTLGFNNMFPALRVYITVGSDNEDILLRNEVRMGYYFQVDGVETLELACNDDTNPVDLLRLTVSNPSFGLTDDYSVTGKYLTTSMESIYGPNEIHWMADRIKIKSGNKLHIRAGYDNNPNNLKTIFNGIVTEVSSEKGVMLHMICEGLGRELLSTQIDPVKARPAGGNFHNSSTGLIFAQALIQDGITHFGTTANNFNFGLDILPGISSDDMTDPESKRLVSRWGGSVFSGDNGFGVHFDKGNLKQRLFTNIYAAEVGTLHPQFQSNLSNYFKGLLSLTEKAGYYYIFEGQTPWEACKEMEYRHPGTKVKPLFYEDRMTMFFGLKEQMYIARDLNSQYMSAVAQSAGDVDNISIDYLKNRYKRMELVTNFHIATSSTNIISNGLSLNSNYHTGVNVVYFEDNEERQDQSQDDFGEFKMTVDDNLNFWEYRYKTISMPGTHGKYSSFMYGTTALSKEAETMYGGKIVLLGNPAIKAGDFIYIDDEVNKMRGVVKVRACNHFFSSEKGFVTEVTPGLYIESSNFFYTTLFQKLGLTAQIASDFSTLSVNDLAFSAKNFQGFFEVFKTYSTLTEATNLNKLDNSISFNTGGGLLIAAGLTMSALLGYTTLKIAGKLGLNAANIRKIHSVGAKGISNISSGLRFVGGQAAATYRMVKGGAAVASSGGVISRVIAAGRVVSAWRLFKVIKGAASVVAAFLLGSNPAGWIVTAIGTLAFSYVDALIQEATLTRQPLMFFPINYVGRPYTAGISGYKYNSWLESKFENLERNAGYAAKGLSEVVINNPDSVASSLLGWMNASFLNGKSNAAAIAAIERSSEKGLSK